MNFIHTADLHLGAPFQGLRSQSPVVAEALDRATYRAFDGIIDLAVESNVRFVLFAGDVYDCEDRNLSAQLHFRKGLSRLHDCGIPSFIIHGNHDHLGGGSANLTWPASTTHFPGCRSDPSILADGNGPDIAVYGYSYPQREVRQSVLGHYAPGQNPGDLFRVGLLHCNVGGNADHGNYAPCTVAELCNVGLDYWALGHVHSFQTLQQPRPSIVYPGSPQGLSPRETGAHGCCQVTVSEDRAVDVKFVAVDGVRWTTMDLSITELNGEDDLLNRMTGTLDAQVQEAGRSVISRVKLTGRGALHGKLKPSVVEALLREMRVNRSGEPFGWIDDIQIDTRSDIDFEARRASEDILGDFLRLCKDAREDPGLRGELKKLVGDLFDRRDLKGLLPDPDECLDGWLDRAEILGADLMTGDDRAL